MNSLHLLNNNKASLATIISNKANIVTKIDAFKDIDLILKNSGIIFIVIIIPNVHPIKTIVLYLFSGLAHLYKIINPPVKNK